MEIKKYGNSQAITILISSLFIVASSCLYSNDDKGKSDYLSLKMLMEISALHKTSKEAVEEIIINIKPLMQCVNLNDEQFAFVSSSQDSLICNSSIQQFQIVQYCFYEKSLFENLLDQIEKEKFKLIANKTLVSGENIMGFYKNGLTIITQNEYSMAHQRIGFRIIFRQTS